MVAAVVQLEVKTAQVVRAHNFPLVLRAIPLDQLDFHTLTIGLEARALALALVAEPIAPPLLSLAVVVVAATGVLLAQAFMAVLAAQTQQELNLRAVVVQVGQLTQTVPLALLVASL
jgi:hypothetical protein